MLRQIRKRSLKKGQALSTTGQALLTTGQAIMEFTFCMIVVLLMIYGTAMIFRWTGMDLAERRIAHENSLYSDAMENFDSPEQGPLNQLESFSYVPIEMNAVWEGK